MMRRNPLAAGELIVIGEQNFVRDTFGTEDLRHYKRSFDAYEGQAILNDNNAFSEYCKRIVHLLGRSFPNTGIEILLHNLVNPTKSIVAIENGDVTGRIAVSAVVYDNAETRKRSSPPTSGSGP
jgi:YheO-like PAS domain